MDIRIVRAPSRGTIELLKRRMRKGAIEDMDQIGAIGLVQGKVVDMICAIDIAEKSVDVIVEEVHGNCPQIFTTLAIFGDYSAVENALETIVRKEEDGEYKWLQQN